MVEGRAKAAGEKRGPFPELTNSQEALLSLKQRHSLHSQNLLSLNRSLEEDIEARKHRVAKLRQTLAQLENQLAQKKLGGKAYAPSGETPQAVRHAAKLQIVPFTPKHFYQLSPSLDRSEVLFSPLQQFPNPDAMQKLENSVKRVAHRRPQRRATYDHDPPLPDDLPARKVLFVDDGPEPRTPGFIDTEHYSREQVDFNESHQEEHLISHHNNQLDIDFENEIQDAFADDCADPVYENDGSWSGDEYERDFEGVEEGANDDDPYNEYADHYDHYIDDDPNDDHYNDSGYDDNDDHQHENNGPVQYGNHPNEVNHYEYNEGNRYNEEEPYTEGEAYNDDIDVNKGDNLNGDDQLDDLYDGECDDLYDGESEDLYDGECDDLYDGECDGIEFSDGVDQFSGDKGYEGDAQTNEEFNDDFDDDVADDIFDAPFHSVSPEFKTPMRVRGEPVTPLKRNQMTPGGVGFNLLSTPLKSSENFLGGNHKTPGGGGFNLLSTPLKGMSTPLPSSLQAQKQHGDLFLVDYDLEDDDFFNE